MAASKKVQAFEICMELDFGASRRCEVGFEPGRDFLTAGERPHQDHFRPERLHRHHSDDHRAMVGGGGMDVEILGPDAQRDRLSAMTAQRLLVGCKQRQAGRRQFDGIQTRRAAEPGIEQVHRRAREKACDEGVDRVAVDFQRRPDLDDPAIAHDADPLAPSSSPRPGRA